MPPSRDRDRDAAPDDTVLSPEDLDITSEDEVAELDEGRYVIGASGKPDVEAGAETASPPDRPSARDETSLETFQRETRQDPHRGSRRSTGSESLSGSDVKRWITAELDRTDSQYAYRIAAKTGEDISHQQLASDDIGMAFDGLLMWYAQQVGGGTAVEEALGILLAESNIRVRYPVRGMVAYLDEHDLDPEDSIADLLAEIRDNEGLVFPLRNRR
ncbi:MAG: hypothetical protein ABEJ78_03240 [Haloferacaceae archaeon]